ncbi:NAD(P)H-binding protein [Proteiniclasticum sp. SCR006]|uniref:NAD(P)H-binding protein n=1 Tax=Proteiniclasticum aestuarii TaxID=2817862 RepID=A0A939H8C4_9CLOT|nr:NAD(P)H-binding protein [Proteiniclasticum aestuarii]MBO1266192.1 NAD(P)H-binding protein [Proteiniclasticum aestuarii]
MQKIAIIGATGMIGSRVLMELIERSYVITAISRHPFELPGSPQIIACDGDVMNEKVVSGHVLALENDVLISAISPDPNDLESFLTATENLIKIAEKSAVKKLITVGGAGSLLLPDGRKLMDREDFPESVKAISKIHERALDIYRSLQGKKFNWINISPAEIIEPDEKRGHYRFGTEDKLLQDEAGMSYITAEDFASAVVDLISDESIENQRVTVAY